MDELKSAWNEANKNMSPATATWEPREQKVTRQIKRQLIIESIAWTALLLVFRDIFDGDEKPLYLNVILASAVLFMLAHNVSGLLAARNLINGTDLKASLHRYVRRLQVFGAVAVLGRALGVAALLWFFCAGMTFNATKYWLLAGALVVIGVQLFLLGRLWAARVTRIRAALSDLQ
ncbi:hypothetical protein MKQ68_06005 [Chitinophaga horti]|uniref:Uncharacterized protein n=1 Tax=Chitinophaga horti TaxID=2920382 RepID=A0ABY6J905_9BACT|nr:hypothetical protein [Chitinophaga horti]UYQ94644.1 hypothetical protein MKQ68_06005 [Chitinophaga horti]